MTTMIDNERFLFATQSLLERRGYVIVHRRLGWAECLISSEDERWLGHGREDAAAFRAAVNQMFPSAAARLLLGDALVAQTEAKDHDASIEGRSYKDATELDPSPAAASLFDNVDSVLDASQRPTSATVFSEASAPEGVAVVLACGEQECVDDEVDLIEAEVDESDAPVPERNDAESTELLPNVETERAPPVRISFYSTCVGESLDRDASIDELAQLTAQLATIESSVAAMAPRRLQLHLLMWSARARALQDRHPGDPEVDRGVRRVVGRLTELSKLYWPGSVPALRFDARPEEAAGMVGRHSDPPRSWKELVGAAEDLAKRSPDAGADEAGWHDAWALHPRPHDPVEIFRAVKVELEGLLFGIGRTPALEDDDHIRLLGPEEIERLVQCGERLRWLRESVEDQIGWGRLMGRLRWAADRLGHRSHELRRILEPSFCPPSAWATRIVGTSQELQRELSRQRLLDDRPWIQGEEPERAGVLSWLTEAFDCFDGSELAGIVEDDELASSSLLSLQDDDIERLTSDRRTRRRLRALRQALGASRVLVPQPDSAYDLDRSSAETGRLGMPDRTEKIVQHARELVGGQHAIFLGNRVDRNLEEVLERDLGLQVDVCEVGARKTAPVSERIRSGRYHLVLAATHLMRKKDNMVLKAAAGHAGIPYIRVNLGRRLACAQAIVRALGQREPR